MSTKLRTVALISGATGVIGNAIALDLAQTPSWEVVLIGRDLNRLDARADAIRQACGRDRVRVVDADLSRKKSIESVASAWEGPLDVLVNVAGVAPRRRETTPDGIELTFATNVLGYLWMTDAFRPHLEASSPARVINVASYWAGDLELDDLEFRTRTYDNHTAYRQSKQANRMLTVAQAAILEGSGVLVNACHPGDPSSVLSRNLGFGGSESPRNAARTPAMLARGEIGASRTGGYFEHGREVTCRFADDDAAIAQLHEICRGYG